MHKLYVIFSPLFFPIFFSFLFFSSFSSCSPFLSFPFQKFLVLIPSYFCILLHFFLKYDINSLLLFRHSGGLCLFINALYLNMILTQTLAVELYLNMILAQTLAVELYLNMILTQTLAVELYLNMILTWTVDCLLFWWTVFVY